jgi:hypothetical protein
MGVSSDEFIKTIDNMKSIDFTDVAVISTIHRTAIG